MARIAEGTIKLTEEDLWRRYRQPASADELMPLSCVMEALRDEDDGLPDRDERALRFSMRIERELKRGGFADVELFYVFENDLRAIDGKFYRDRWDMFRREDADFARKTYVDNLMVPLESLVGLSLDGLPLPKSLVSRYDTLKRTASEECKCSKANKSTTVPDHLLEDHLATTRPEMRGRDKQVAKAFFEKRGRDDVWPNIKDDWETLKSNPACANLKRDEVERIRDDVAKRKNVQLRSRGRPPKMPK